MQQINFLKDVKVFQRGERSKEVEDLNSIKGDRQTIQKFGSQNAHETVKNIKKAIKQGKE